MGQKKVEIKGETALDGREKQAEKKIDDGGNQKTDKGAVSERKEEEDGQ